MGTASAVSSAFIWRRVHSLMGLWLVLYLMEHLLVNSQAALWLGDDGIGFIRLVNLIQSIPYLQVVETVLIGIPLAIHGVWGIKRALSAKTNSWKTSGKEPSLASYGRNQAFTWQRLAAWILLFGIVGHVLQMRFLEKPKEAAVDGKKSYFNRITFDQGLYTLAPRLGVMIYGPEQIASLISEKPPSPEKDFPADCKESLPREGDFLQKIQKAKEEKQWIKTLASYRLKGDQVIAVSPDPGTGLLLMVRNAFKNPLLAALYTLFVLAAAYHAFNGFWTFLITWGVILSYRSQRAMIPVSVLGMGFLTFLGLAAIWGSYWMNLRS